MVGERPSLALQRARIVFAWLLDLHAAVVRSPVPYGSQHEVVFSLGPSRAHVLVLLLEVVEQEVEANDRLLLKALESMTPT